MPPTSRDPVFARSGDTRNRKSNQGVAELDPNPQATLNTNGRVSSSDSAAAPIPLENRYSIQLASAGIVFPRPWLTTPRGNLSFIECPTSEKMVTEWDCIWDAFIDIPHLQQAFCYYRNSLPNDSPYKQSVISMSRFTEFLFEGYNIRSTVAPTIDPGADTELGDSLVRLQLPPPRLYSLQYPAVDFLLADRLSSSSCANLMWKIANPRKPINTGILAVTGRSLHSGMEWLLFHDCIKAGLEDGRMVRIFTFKNSALPVHEYARLATRNGQFRVVELDDFVHRFCVNLS